MVSGGGGLLGVSQQIALVVLPLLADIMSVRYETLVNWQAAGSFLFLFSSLFWAKMMTTKGVSFVVKVTTAGFLLSNLVLLFLWLGYTWLSVELMLGVFIVSRLIHGVFSSGIVPQLQVSALMLYPQNSIGALAKVSLGGTLARCLTPLACIGLIMLSPTWVFALPLLLSLFVLLTTPSLTIGQSKTQQSAKLRQHWGLLIVAFICAFSLCFGQFSLVQVLTRFIPDNSVEVSQWVAINLALTACLSTFNQLYFIKKKNIDSEKLLVLSLAIALLMACLSSVANDIFAICVFVSLIFVALNSATLAYTNIIVAKAGKHYANYVTTTHTLGYALGAVFVNFSVRLPYALICAALFVAFSFIIGRFIRCAYIDQAKSL
ncbi:hypothetical protein [Pseudoalteromonas sp. S16_S37]|uniref:hypothetical protein n=1 Tax=Pseudoalteromonas sp. S16_S37 TaxID=2720228 RepID=UPI0016807591|nr:hypothetical protein [Pseudoalteromonas sp. S16_S37]MBD1584610.1 hypothetical protein [Pseudoalteromonas sp. S16_S37]